MRLSQNQKKKQRRTQVKCTEISEINLCLTSIDLDSPYSVVKPTSNAKCQNFAAQNDGFKEKDSSNICYNEREQLIEEKSKHQVIVQSNNSWNKAGFRKRHNIK